MKLDQRDVASASSCSLDECSGCSAAAVSPQEFSVVSPGPCKHAATRSSALDASHQPHSDMQAGGAGQAWSFVVRKSTLTERASSWASKHFTKPTRDRVVAELALTRPNEATERQPLPRLLARDRLP